VISFMTNYHILLFYLMMLWIILGKRKHEKLYNLLYRNR
jgi:hypothetical protein